MTQTLAVMGILVMLAVRRRADDSGGCHLPDHRAVVLDASEGQSRLRRIAGHNDCWGRAIAVNALEQFLGPLAIGKSVRRGLRPAWLRWTSMVAALPAAGVVVFTVWLVQTLFMFDPSYLPGSTVTGGLLVLIVWQVIFALLMSPALVAGTFAGEKDRGTLALLLISRQSAGEIVWARYLGRLMQVAVLALSGLPPPPCILLAAALPGQRHAPSRRR